MRPPICPRFQYLKSGDTATVAKRLSSGHCLGVIAANQRIRLMATGPQEGRFACS